MAIDIYRKDGREYRIEKLKGKERVKARVTENGKAYELEFVERATPITPDFVEQHYEKMSVRDQEALEKFKI